jgi:hypothetical protein
MRSTPVIVELSVLALWLGAALLFSAAVAPALFAVLPTRTLAGAVVGRLLPVIFYSGMLVGAAVVAIELLLHGRWNWRGREAPGAVMLASCGIAQLVVGPRIERLRADIGGVLEMLAADDARRAAFGRLHGASVAWLGLGMIAAVVAIVLSARSLAGSRHVNELAS